MRRPCETQILRYHAPAGAGAADLRERHARAARQLARKGRAGDARRHRGGRSCAALTQFAAGPPARQSSTVVSDLERRSWMLAGL